MFKLTKIQFPIFAGDVVVLTLVTLAGFATHNTLGTAGTRILTTFIPLLLAWLLIGSHVGVFDPEKTAAPRDLWRPFWAMILAAPLFGLIRAWMLGVDSISATFLVVMGGIGSLSIFAWRAVYVFLTARRQARVKENG